MLDDIAATVRNARWREVICAEFWRQSLKRNSPPKGRAARPAEPGKNHSSRPILPENLPLVKPEIIISGEGGALPTCVPPL